MTIILLHKHYDDAHLSEVSKKMLELGAPVIRGIHDRTTGSFLALEGCHRIRAAKALGITPELVDVGIYDEDGYIDFDAMEGLTINSLTDEDNMQDDPDATVGDHLDYIGHAWGLAIIEFEED